MAVAVPYDSGAGSALGSELLTSKPLYHTGAIWYVHHTGSDAAAPRGKERIRPLATTAQAFTNAAAGDWIVWLSGHTELPAAVLTINKARIKFIAEGPLGVVKITRSFNGILFDVAADDVLFEGLYLPASTAVSASARVRVANARAKFEGCYFEHGSNDTGTGIQLVTGWSGLEHRNTTHKSVATSVTAQPESAITVTNAGTGFRVYKSTLDGGASGWSNPYAFNGAAAVTAFEGVLIDQLNDSDGIMATGSTGFRIPRFTSGSARWEWPA